MFDGVLNEQLKAIVSNFVSNVAIKPILKKLKISQASRSQIRIQQLFLDLFQNYFSTFDFKQVILTYWTVFNKYGVPGPYLMDLVSYDFCQMTLLYICDYLLMNRVWYKYHKSGISLNTLISWDFFREYNNIHIWWVLLRLTYFEFPF